MESVNLKDTKDYIMSPVDSLPGPPNFKHKFKDAFDSQNTVALGVIQSLDSLNDQIVHYVFYEQNIDINFTSDLSPKEQDKLRSSVILIRKLLQDAQSKFRKMMEENKQLALKIDGSIQAANEEVNALKAQLADTNKILFKITASKVEAATQTENEDSNRQRSDEENEILKLKEENCRLESQVKDLVSEMEDQKLSKATATGELKLDLFQAQQELTRAKDALQAMSADRKKVKTEKLDLLHQMSQLYMSLEEKDKEIREYNKNYENLVQETHQKVKQIAKEKETLEKEKWDIVKKTKESAERAIVLKIHLEEREETIKKLEEELAFFKDTYVHGANKSVCLSDLNASSSQASMSHDVSTHDVSTHDVSTHDISTQDVTAASEDLPPYEITPLVSNSSKDSPSNSSFSLQTSTPINDSNDAFNSLTKVFSTSQELSDNSDSSARRKKRHLFGSFPRMFSKGRLRRSIALPNTEGSGEPNASKLTLLGPENYQEKMSVVNSLEGLHIGSWKAHQVLAWIEISLGLSTYGKMCAENIKSGKVLLGLSDSDIGTVLGISNPIHRRKLRLAIEEHRDPTEIKYPKAGTIDHTWIAHRWLADLGLPQHTPVFENQLADGRILNLMGKKDLEKYFKVRRKFHQISILHGIELLRRVNFDKEVLSERRSHCEENNGDPLMWTNQRVMKWIQSIELDEYADNLKESGIHGALMVLEPTFSANTLATALGIPPSKPPLRRHLASEFDALIKPARAALDAPNNNNTKPKEEQNGTHWFSRSASSFSESRGSKARLSFRGSLGRAFGRKIKQDLMLAFETDSAQARRKISAPIPIQRDSLDSSISEASSTPV